MTRIIEHDKSAEHAGETGHTSKDSHVVVYENSDGKRWEEPACPRCLTRFAFDETQRQLICKSLSFYDLLEDYDDSVWVTATDSPSSSGCSNLRRIRELRERCSSAVGPCDLSFEDLRILRAALHVALAASVLSPVERDTVPKLFEFLSQYLSHLSRNHFVGTETQLTYEVLTETATPLYLGGFGLEKAWAIAPEIRGTSLEEATAILRRKVEMLPIEARNSIATSHLGHPGSEKVLERAILTAIKVVEAERDEWLKVAEESTSCVAVSIVADAVHDQVFFIDELLSRGCLRNAPEHSSDESQRVFRAIEGIGSLIDWSECEALAQWMEQMREAPDVPNSNSPDW